MPTGAAPSSERERLACHQHRARTATTSDEPANYESRDLLLEYSLATMPVSLFPAEMHEQSAVVLGVFLDPVIQGFDLFLIEKPENPLF